jgi:hypothetical protein
VFSNHLLLLKKLVFLKVFYLFFVPKRLIQHSEKHEVGYVDIILKRFRPTVGMNEGNDELKL